MSVRRVIGTETEYGISVPGQPGANAMVTSSQVVNAYQAATAARARRARWDFEEENPLRDARGFDLAAETADSSQLTDEDLGLANVILTNGARLYVDHAHPEYSAPECTNPLDAVIWDKAGERVMAEAASRAGSMPSGAAIQLYKNNTDNKGASYGCHENYLMSRATPFADIVRHLTPFFVSRQVVCGAGRVGRGADGRDEGFQISQRADFFEVEVGLETTLKRPIINTRDEPHADPEKYRRLHVTIGDANMSEISSYLKLGTTSLVLAMIEDRFLGSDLARSHLPAPGDAARRAPDDRDPAPARVPGPGPQVHRGPLRRGCRRHDQGRARPLGFGADPARRGPHALLAGAGLGHQARGARGVPDERRAGLDRPPAAARRPAVRRRAGRSRPLQPARRQRPAGPAGRRAGRGEGHRVPARGHQGLLPRPLPAQVPGRGGRGVLGLGHLRYPGPGVAAARPDPGAAARHEGARRRAARPL